MVLPLSYVHVHEHFLSHAHTHTTHLTTFISSHEGSSWGLWLLPLLWGWCPAWGAQSAWLAVSPHRQSGPPHRWVGEDVCAHTHQIMPANTFQNANYMNTTISLKVKLVLPCVGVDLYQIWHNLAVSSEENEGAWFTESTIYCPDDGCTRNPMGVAYSHISCHCYCEHCTWMMPL